MHIDEVGEDFGALVRKAREARQWTQADLAGKLSALLGKEVPTLAVTRTESAKRPVPLVEVAALAHLLNLQVDPLLNPSPLEAPPEELHQRAEEIRTELNEAHQEEARLMAEYASVSQRLRACRERRDDLERQLQAMTRTVRVRFGGRHGSAELEKAFEEDQRKGAEGGE